MTARRACGPRRGPGPLRVLAALVLVAAGLATSACATTAPGSAGAADSGGRISVVAAENFWGSIAAQLGGDRVTETSLISNPQTDPHSYEPTAADALRIAGARLFIQNGIGYDSSWAPSLVAANPSSARTVLTVGDVLGLSDGDNPHQWYSRASVYAVIDAITTAYQRIDPAGASYFAERRTWFENTALADYNRLETEIKAQYAGTPIGASESIVSPLADSLGLDLRTPYSFLKDISEGSDPTAADKSLIDQQITDREIKVYVYNSQNSTPDIQAQIALARQQGIPVTTVTETLSPAGDTFQQWMVTQLQSLEAALAEATGHQ
ncbi:zinc ABC transporter substrate-binding protein [Actinospica durhamensis]|uniref:Zinc ABC transporter substrate-binding protein n=1 Tax=Actinospica durhamensis TaxID=1508375 RepID=A0A941ISM3_9ACTN|nr:zinc ABC transporter substrate-binding protein [Actinospica durhamensis]MBR7833366.1 zinc ABC transporter substrate-binding protein [Actinospica durhamensis]